MNVTQGSMDRIICQLPGGYVDQEGVVHREIELRALSGREEEYLVTQGERESASLVTVILSRCIHRIGLLSPVSEKEARNLLIADREYLLLKLREITFGDQVQATIPCPWPDCGKKVDIDFSLKDIPIKKLVDKGPYFTMTLSDEAAFTDADGEVYGDITFRLPTGSDQEAVSPYIQKNEAMALTMLLTRCIQNIGPLRAPGEELISRLSPLARMEIEKHMEAVAPRVDLTMVTTCPECGREFTAPFDLHEFFFGELRISLDLLYREVHYLAYHYHWSEEEIMKMSREKRHKYIEVLADEIERVNNAA
ncbi:MAG: DUF6760 family protein [bacterium]